MQFHELEADGKFIRFPTTDGLLLEGFLLSPKHAKACAVYVHGMFGSFYDSNLPFVIGEKLNAQGAALFAINTRGHDGESSITRKNINKLDAVLGTKFEKFEGCVADIGGAIKILKKRGFKNIILIGQSTGCQKSIFYQYKTRDRRVNGIVLLGPGDDYYLSRSELGKEFNKIVASAKRLVRARKRTTIVYPRKVGFPATRFLSYADLKNVEGRIFNYNGPLREFGKIKVPVFAIFGSKDRSVPKSIKECLNILKKKSTSTWFSSKIIKGARHSLKKHEDEAAVAVSKWIAALV